jgi:glucose-6-phosphate 1-epimerase
MGAGESLESIDFLNERFGRAGRLRFTVNSSGLIAADVATELCRGQVFLQGGHITAFQPTGQVPLLWTSSASLYQPGRAIRGGIPVCWPWFGNHPHDPSKPAHGFARTALWKVVSAEHAASGEIILTLALTDNPQTRLLWPHAFSLSLTIIFGSSLRLSLGMENRSLSAMTISCALHTYLRVADWQTCRIYGLEDSDYLDKVAGYARRHQTGPLGLTQETDRIYLLSDAVCRIQSPETSRDIVIHQQGSSATVVWNPGSTRARTMPDMAAEEYRRMVCLESAIAPQKPVILQPGAGHALTAEICAAS